GGPAGRVSSAGRWPKDGGGTTIKPDVTLNLAFTAAGLAGLGVAKDVLRTFSDEFLLGMATRAGTLGDVGPSAPAHWDDGLGSGKAHVLVTINARTSELRDDQLLAVIEAVERAGVTVAQEELAELQEFQREHFGFSDGFG